MNWLMYIGGDCIFTFAMAGFLIKWMGFRNAVISIKGYDIGNGFMFLMSWFVWVWICWEFVR